MDLGSDVFGPQDVAVDKKPEPFVVMMTIDRETSSVVLTRSDGKEARQSIAPAPFESTSVLSRLHWSPALGDLVAVTCKGDDIAFELPVRDRSDQLEQRLVVYLDQWVWRRITEALQGGTTVDREDRDAAEQLAEWVRDRRIVLPASAGHYYETTKWASEHNRYRLGLTILQLSRGWQMLDPLQVRRDEIDGMFRRWLGQDADGRATAVFTLTPNSLHSSSRMVPYTPPSDFSTDDAFRMVALTAASAYIDVMLDTERVEPGPEPGWVQFNQRFSDWLDGQNWDSQQKRRSIDALLFADFRNELAEGAQGAGLSPQDLQRWGQKQPMNGFSILPATGLYRAMLHHRHLNRGTTWKRSDLTDMIYLSCAAGYADFVVCEKHMREPLERGVRRLGLRTKVFRHLSEAVAAIGHSLEHQAHDIDASAQQESNDLRRG
ncbi:hypothetical protein ACGFY9_27480 [Streptomyces sp. NPDC048504]|uniref:hypothetical protein n=1 Tax=Streptomyces sp. NPDC048504 TaxID=3365559 RepID=UPI00371E5FF1